MKEKISSFLMFYSVFINFISGRKFNDFLNFFDFSVVCFKEEMKLMNYIYIIIEGML